ncbi:hypothetical protein MXB_869 [Myxobolus squamalis]|nr:hypothetical protein MXB_869 [Myxobolus squamalis]
MSIVEKQVGKSKNRSGTELVRTNSSVGKSGNAEFLEMINDFQYQIIPKKISISDIIQNDTKIIVCVRKRPLNARENSRAEIDIICVPDAHSILVHECKLKVDLTKYLDNHKFQY